METKDIILFDGICNFCDATINFVINHDKKGNFVFAPLQSSTGEALLKKFAISREVTDSMVLIEGEKVYVKSTAALRISRKLNGLYPLLYGFIILPKFIRDSVYDLIAKNRYKWFGKKDSCMLPTPEIRQRFLA